MSEPMVSKRSFEYELSTNKDVSDRRLQFRNRQITQTIEETQLSI